MSDTCAAEHCHVTIGPDAPTTDFCSYVCAMSWNQQGLDLIPVRPSGMSPPEMKDLTEVETRKMTRAEAAFDWLDARARTAS